MPLVASAPEYRIEATNGVESAFYKADDEDVLNEHEFNLCPWWRGPTCSPIHMPRWASRLTLTVTAVRVKRLQDISEEDARAEGIERLPPADPPLHLIERFRVYGAGGEHLACPYGARVSYSTLWDSLHGHGAWDLNPWIAALTFSVEHQNIDAANRSAA